MYSNHYPGHMARAKRLLREKAAQVDTVLEVLDARIPKSSRSGELDGVLDDKYRILILNKADLAQPETTGLWVDRYREKEGLFVFPVSALRGDGVGTLNRLLNERGNAGGRMRMMIVGIPNVGKSTLLNRISGRKKARVEDRPGVTRGEQWIHLPGGWRILDTPGLLPPGMEDEEHAFRLAATGALRFQDFDPEAVACHLIDLFHRRGRAGELLSPYDWDAAGQESFGGPEWAYSILQGIAKARGCLQSGGRLDTERAAGILLRDFQQGKLGRISLEVP